jgi:hypothetical protein
MLAMLGDTNNGYTGTLTIAVDCDTAACLPEVGVGLGAATAALALAGLGRLRDRKERD